ncbi:ATP-binding protein [Bifidobacterium jacchi]|uniref:ATP-binding protein n=1 Tax=Bifidobacterium jacchi TaxID=2490545 RepID=UPI001F4F8806|nr:ATP-binding protein [Bifidobacterium jacchi]
MAIIGESNSGKGSVLANIIAQEAAAGGEIWFIDLKAGMEAENYAQVLDRKAYNLDEAETMLADFNTGVDTRAQQWRGKLRSLNDNQAAHRLLVIDEAADMIRSGASKKKSDACVELVRSALSRSRALNCTVVVATQNPRVTISLPYRSLLLTTLALRLNSKSEAVMAMGEDAVRRGARPWQIPFTRPGDGYLWDTETNQVRYLHVPFVTDEEIHALRRVGGDGNGRSGSGSPVPATPSTSGYRGLLRRPLLRCEMRDEDA